MLYTMGGALAVDGNAPNGTAEWNYFVDPHAVANVLDSGVRTTIVPLDATDNVPVTRAFFDRLTSAASSTPVASAVQGLMAESHSYESDFFFWDEFTAALAVESLATIVERDDRSRDCGHSRGPDFAGPRWRPSSGCNRGRRRAVRTRVPRSTDRRSGRSRRARSPGRRLLHRDADCDADVLRVIRHVVRVAPCGRAGAGVHCRSRNSDRRGHRSPHPRVLHIVLDECCRLRVGIPRRDRDGSRARGHA